VKSWQIFLLGVLLANGSVAGLYWLTIRHIPARDLTIAGSGARVVTGVRFLPDSIWRLDADSGAYCLVTHEDWTRAHPGETWACRWRR
jgi:hypothetical protein